MAEQENLLIKVKVVSGDMPKVVNEMATEENCDIIIVGHKKQSGIFSFFKDYVINKLIDTAPCPVFVAPA